MRSFCHTPENEIIINEKYRFSLELFKKLEPNYSLPEIIISRRYFSGKKHEVSSGDHREFLPLLWTEGERLIDRLPELVYLEQHEQIKEQERLDYVNRIKNNADSPV